MALIETVDLWKTYIMGSEEIHALRGVSISIERGDYVAIMGLGYSGKSTLMNLAPGHGGRPGRERRQPTSWRRSAVRCPGARPARRRAAGPRLPNSCTWSVVWLALVPRSRAGRSAVSSDQRHPGVRGLEDRGVQVRDRRAAGRDDHDRPLAGAWRCRARGSRPTRSSMRVCSRSRSCGGVRREGQRRAARPGGQHDVADPAADQLVDEGGRQGRRGVRRGHARRTYRPRSRSRQCRSRSGAAAARRQGVGVHLGPADGQHTVDRQQRLGGHVVGEQLHGGQPAGVGQLGQRGRQGHPGRDADAGLQRAGHHDRQADVLGDPQARAHPAERLHLEHRDVGRLEVAHPVGVLGAPDRLVRGDRHVDPAPHDGEVLDARRTGCSTYSSPPAALSSTRDPRSPPRRPTTARWRRPGPGRRARARRAPPPAGPPRRPGSARARRP